MLLGLILTILQVDPVQALPVLLSPSPSPSPYYNLSLPLSLLISPSPSNANHIPIQSDRGEVFSGPADFYREKYAPLVSSDVYAQEGAQASVITSTGSSEIVQSLPPLTTAVPDTTGSVVTSLETDGRTSIQPFPTEVISEPESLITGQAAIAASTTAGMAPQEAATLKDIFGAPIATSAPLPEFPRRTDHPVPRHGIVDQGPHSTNKFFSNLFLGSQNAPTYLFPYSVAWAKGQGASSSWGMAISHVEERQRVYGPRAAETGASKYFLSPVGIQSLVLSAMELGSATVLTLDHMLSQSVQVHLLREKGAKPSISFPLVQGQGFITAVYYGNTPVIQTGVYFKTVTKSVRGPKEGVTKYSIYLEDGTTWHVYGYSASGESLELNVLNSGFAVAAKPYNGIIQVSKDAGQAETVLDAAAGAYATGVLLSGSTAGNKGSYTFTYQKEGLANTRLMMYALPHHVDSFDADTYSAVTAHQLLSPTKGMAMAVVADSWTMVEPNMPLTMGFAPWDPVTGPKVGLSATAINTISPVALKEISQDMEAQSNQNSMYFSGKALAKFAHICFAVNDLLKNPTLAAGGLTNLKAAFARFISNRQQFPLYYETAWGGLVSSASYETGNNGADFGNTLYNDHHFHYGYFIMAAAIIGYLDPSWLTQQNVAYINTMVRDVANPSSQDNYFPVFRNFDWYHGHSWAHGLYETLDGKDQESSSEDAMSAYAIKMWGHVIKDVNMEARGNLMLSIITRSLSNYYLYTEDNKVQPAKFIGNRVAGILFENKIDHTTYFGPNIEYIQGIHMLPLLASSKLTRSARFVQQEWATYFDNGRVDQVSGGWKGILYGNLATIDPAAAWHFFTARDFDPSWLDGGASLTWYQAYTAALMG